MILWPWEAGGGSEHAPVAVVEPTPSRPSRPVLASVPAVSDSPRGQAPRRPAEPWMLRAAERVGQGIPGSEERRRFLGSVRSGPAPLPMMAERSQRWRPGEKRDHSSSHPGDLTSIPGVSLPLKKRNTYGHPGGRQEQGVTGIRSPRPPAAHSPEAVLPFKKRRISGVHDASGGGSSPSTPFSARRFRDSKSPRDLILTHLFKLAYSSGYNYATHALT